MRVTWEGSGGHDFLEVHHLAFWTGEKKKCSNCGVSFVWSAAPLSCPLPTRSARLSFTKYLPQMLHISQTLSWFNTEPPISFDNYKVAYYA